MRILFCDQSIDEFGYSVYEEQGDRFQLLKYGIIKLDTSLDYFDRILTLEPILDALIQSFNIVQAVIEDIQYQTNVETYKKLSSLQFFLRYYFLNRKIDCHPPVQVNVWRNFVNRKYFGLQKGDKDSLFSLLNNALHEPKGFKDDHTDAIGIGIWFGKIKLNKTEIVLTTGEMEEIKAKNYQKGSEIDDIIATTTKNKSGSKANRKRKGNTKA